MSAVREFAGRRLVSAAAALLLLGGCATVNFDDTLAKTNREAGAFTQGKLALALTPDQRAEMDRTAAELLAQPLSQEAAVRLALVNSPALQALLAQSWADAADAGQSGRIPNPVFTFERMRLLDELELGRLLSFGLLDLLTLPQRYGMAQRRIEQAQLLLTGDVIDRVTQVRQAWVKAVAARQMLEYAWQVNETAAASAELARRMQAAGNFSKLQRVRQQAFYADAATQLAAAQHKSTASREELVRALGLTDAQAQILTLPPRLPDLPKSPRGPDEVGRSASAGRIDVRMAQAAFEAAGKAQGLNVVTSLTDIELGLRRDTVTDRAAGTSDNRLGYEISLRLPVFDWGGLRRDGMNARTLAAGNRLEASLRAAGSSLRESYSAYRTAWDVARHYRDEIVPLRKIIAEENLLRYNGMIIGVFELLADSQAQVGAVSAAIAAEQQFWLADAALQASILGKPTNMMIGAVASGSAGGGDGGH